MLMVFIGEGVRNAMDPRKAIRIRLPKKHAGAVQPGDAAGEATGEAAADPSAAVETKP